MLRRGGIRLVRLQNKYHAMLKFAPTESLHCCNKPHVEAAIFLNITAHFFIR